MQREEDGTKQLRARESSSAGMRQVRIASATLGGGRRSSRAEAMQRRVRLRVGRLRMSVVFLLRLTAAIPRLGHLLIRRLENLPRACSQGGADLFKRI
jgi:hypothetical protein